jgi:hypothetical protein
LGRLKRARSLVLECENISHPFLRKELENSEQRAEKLCSELEAAKQELDTKSKKIERLLELNASLTKENNSLRKKKRACDAIETDALGEIFTVATAAIRNSPPFLKEEGKQVLRVAAKELKHIRSLPGDPYFYLPKVVGRLGETTVGDYSRQIASIAARWKTDMENEFRRLRREPPTLDNPTVGRVTILDASLYLLGDQVEACRRMFSHGSVELAVLGAFVYTARNMRRRNDLAEILIKLVLAGRGGEEFASLPLSQTNLPDWLRTGPRHFLVEGTTVFNCSGDPDKDWLNQPVSSRDLRPAKLTAKSNRSLSLVLRSQYLQYN